MEPLDIPVIPPLPDCYKKDHNFVTLSSAAVRLGCTEPDLLVQMKNGKLERFAQTILTDTDKYPDGREYLRKPVFRLTELQLECVLENKGYTMDLDPELNGWLWSCPPRQVLVVVKDLRVLLPKCDLDDSENAPFDPAEHLNQRLTEGLSKDEITVELVEKYGTKKEKHYGLIARKLYIHTPSDSKVTWRKRGQRDYESAKKRLAAKNATPSHPPVTP